MDTCFSVWRVTGKGSRRTFPEMELLLEDVIERSSDILPEGASKLGKTPVIDWTPDVANLYPDKQATIIHVNTLLYVHERWISELGKFAARSCH